MSERKPTERRNFTFSVATNKPRGFFQVGEWEFLDQDFNSDEASAFDMFLDRDTQGNANRSTDEALVYLLNQRLPSEQSKEVTLEWLNGQLGGGDKGRLLDKLMILVQNRSHEQPG